MKKQQMIILSLSILLLVLIQHIGCLEKSSESTNTWQPIELEYYQIHITSIIDGDTVQARMPSGNIETIRLLGIDTPELFIDDNNEYEYHSITNLTCLTYYAHQSKNYTEEHLLNTPCFIQFDADAGYKDVYDRWLSYIYLDNNTDFNADLIRKGFARVYVKETFYKKEDYLKLEENAIEDNIGLWSCK